MKKRGAKSLKSVLLRDVRDRLSKVFVEKGFSFVPLPPDELSSELKQAFPLGRLKRRRGNGLDVIEFQFDKYGGPKFVINFGVVPEDGVTLPWGIHLDQNIADVSALFESYRLYSSSMRTRWFTLGLFSSKNEQSITRIVDNAIMLSSEINDWFESKSVGRHIRAFNVH